MVTVKDIKEWISGISMLWGIWISIFLFAGFMAGDIFGGLLIGICMSLFCTVIALLCDVKFLQASALFGWAFVGLPVGWMWMSSDEGSLQCNNLYNHAFSGLISCVLAVITPFIPVGLFLLFVPASFSLGLTLAISMGMSLVWNYLLYKVGFYSYIQNEIKNFFQDASWIDYSIYSVKLILIIFLSLSSLLPYFTVPTFLGFFTLMGIIGVLCCMGIDILMQLSFFIAYTYRWWKFTSPSVLRNAHPWELFFNHFLTAMGQVSNYCPSTIKQRAYMELILRYPRASVETLKQVVSASKWDWEDKIFPALQQLAQVYSLTQEEKTQSAQWLKTCNELYQCQDVQPCEILWKAFNKKNTSISLNPYVVAQEQVSIPNPIQGYRMSQEQILTEETLENFQQGNLQGAQKGMSP